MLVLLMFIVASAASLLFAPARNQMIAPLAVFFFVMFIVSGVLQYFVGSSGPEFCAVAWLPILLIKNKYDKQQGENRLKKEKRDSN